MIGRVINQKDTNAAKKDNFMRNCDKCAKELTPVFPDRSRRYNDLPQYDDALVIKLSGGYGMLIDDFVAPFVLCGDCGRELIQSNYEWMITPEIEFLSKEGD